MIKVHNLFFDIIVFLGFSIIPAAYAEMYFPKEMLMSDDANIADLSNFKADGTQLPGIYLVDIYLNQHFVASKSVRFNHSYKSTDGTGLKPCLSKKDLILAGIKTDLFPSGRDPDDSQCVDFDKMPTTVSLFFDFVKMRLDIKLPQAFVNNKAHGYIDPSLWDEGINAGFLNYRFSGNNSLGGQYRSSNYFFDLKTGLNLGAWRLRDDRNWSYYNNDKFNHQDWQHISTYIERAIIPLKSNLLIGEATTDSDVFDSINMRGIQISTDDDMYPDTMKGFAPVIRGVAGGNAEVTVRQNGYNIYKTNVSPGPFEINDLSPMFSSGELNVIVQESNGVIHTFTVPYSTVPSLLREGHMKYSVVAGRLRYSSSNYDSPSFWQGTFMLGMPHGITIHAGTQFSSKYLAFQSGIGVDLGTIGGVSADLTQAESTLANGQSYSGQSMKFMYSHIFSETDTNLRLTGYQYSTSGFHTLEETALNSMSSRYYDYVQQDQYGQQTYYIPTNYYSLYSNKRARIEANIAQNIGGAGSVYLTGVRQTYWHSNNSDTSIKIGYSNTINNVSYSLFYDVSYRKNDGLPSYNDHSLNLSLSFPLSIFSHHNSIYTTLNSTRDNQGNWSQQTGLNGTLLEKNNLSWNISQGYTDTKYESGFSGNAGMSYKGSAGYGNISYSHGKNYKKLNYGISGGMVVHRHGVTLGQSIGESAGLISTSGISGINIGNTSGIQTDWNGYAIMPYASAYNENWASIDTRYLDINTDVDKTSEHFVPTKGAIVGVDFVAHHGFRALIALSRDDKPLPFGTIVTSGDSSGIVGDGGLVYLSGLHEQGTIKASWGGDSTQTCQANYHFDESELSTKIIRISKKCLR